MLSGIVAMTRQRVMGKENTLPWNIPSDLKFFREKTINHRIIMGRKTFESLGAQPLPRRQNWVISMTGRAQVQGVKFFRTKADIMAALNKFKVEDEMLAVKTYVIGGSKIFEMFWPEISEMFVTWVEKPFEGDVFFPELNWDRFKVVSEHAEPEPVPHKFCHYMLNETAP